MIRRWRSLPPTVLFLLLTAFPVRAQEPSVKTILFYNPDCDACKTLINQVLPPLLLEHGRNLLVLTIDVNNPQGAKLYQSAVDSLVIPSGEQFVPLLIIESEHLSGLETIRNRLPGLIDEKLAAGGSDWPPIPGLEEALQKAGFSSAPTTPWEKFLSDWKGNTLAVIVLAGLIASLIFSLLITFRPVAPKFPDAVPAWVFPVLLGVGVLVASYLTYTEVTDSEVFCGGFSRCTDVQESPYSKIFGVINVGEFGLAGYFLIGLAWLVHKFSRGTAKTAAAIAMFGFALFGVTFSLYLTFLEPFVIGATCLWCLTSAVIMGLILPLTTTPVRTAIQPYAQSGKSIRASGG
jgi:uncharacterized membrane protein